MPESLDTVFSAFPSALWAGLVMAVACSFLGVFVILKRVVFIGAALSQVAALGVALGLLWEVSPLLSSVAVTFLTATLLAYPFETKRLPRDAVLGIIFVVASAASILVVAKGGFELANVRARLYGDLILTTGADLKTILVILLPVMAAMLLFLRPIVITFADRDEAKVLGIRVVFWELFFFYALGLTVSAASTIGGMLLVFCFLVVPPATGLLLANRLWLVLLLSALSAAVATLVGLCGAVEYDWPTNHVIAMVSTMLFVLALVAKGPLVMVARLRVRSCAADRGVPSAD
ncbi:MAG: metal ABC transporter permease [Planctomycetota bacterium]|nr:metal ABC transporter permease [Planctomycetota bacterium]